MNRSLNAFRLLLFATLANVLSVGFGYKMAVAGTISGADAALVRTILVLERGETALAARSADHRQTLTRVLEALPADAQEFVRSDLQTFLRRVPDKGADFECGSEFVRLRARQELERIKDTLLNAGPLPPEPQFCYAVPFAIDLGQPRKTLEIYGFDLDTKPLELFVVNKDGSFEDVSSALKMRTHYHWTVNIGLGGVKFSPQSQMLSVAWGHIIRYSVSVIQPATDLCMSQIEEIPAGKTITFSPQRINGSLGAGAAARASAILNYESNKVDATVCMTAPGQERDSATYVGCGVEYVYTTDPDRVIEGVFTELESFISGIHLDPGQNIVAGRRDTAVAKWVFDVPGAESKQNVELSVTAVLPRIRIVSTKIDNCLPAVAYLEARRRNAIASETARRLDTQARNVQREISKLRPRFAP